MILALVLLFSGCAAQQGAQSPDILATTAPLAQLVRAIVDGTDLTVATLISEPVSCVHDYALSVEQMRAVETAKLVVTNGAGLEEFMSSALSGRQSVVDASAGLTLLTADHDGHDDHDGHADHDDHDDHDGHADHGETDPHIWLAPENMIAMTRTVESALAAAYPQHAALFEENAARFTAALAELQAYGAQQLSALSCRELVTFHDGFAYFARAFGLEIAASMEIEAGSEPSARELESIIALLRDRDIPAVFTETNGTTDAAELVSRETGCAVFTLDTAISAADYFEAMRQNIDTVKEALG